jgi:hypothetical protein
MQRLCARCHYAVTLEDEGTLIFCGHCGAPQVRLSQELLDEIQTAHETFTADATAAQNTRETEPGGIDWKGAINCAALAGIIAFLLSALSGPLKALGLLTFFWMLAAPSATLGIYAARFRETRIAAGFGARLGLLVGLAISFALLASSVGEMLLRRYAMHGGGEMDSQMHTTITGMQAQLIQQSGAAAAAPVVTWLNLPDFRAGLLLTGALMCTVFYLVFATTFGALAGFFRSRTRTA